jgi:CheY-like chemotaxis protein
VASTTPSKTRILLVDDDEDLRGIIRRFLDRSGFSVTTATHGREALERLATERADLVVTDLMMPEMSGLELIRELRSGHPTLPIIAMSAGADLRGDRSLEQASQAGARVVLEKPFAMHRLIHEIRALLAASAVD